MALPGFLPRVDTWEKRMMSYGSGNKQENYQAEMAKRAVANGFLFGKGPGKGHVKNDLYLGLDDQQGMLLYGTNAVGKTSLIRAMGICVVLAQSGMFVPCSSFIFKPYTYIFSICF